MLARLFYLSMTIMPLSSQSLQPQSGVEGKAPGVQVAVLFSYIPGAHAALIFVVFCLVAILMSKAVVQWKFKPVNKV